MMSSKNFLEIIKVINCLTIDEFIGIYGQNRGVHIYHLKAKMGANFLFKLDDESFEELFNAAETKRRINYVKRIASYRS